MQKFKEWYIDYDISSSLERHVNLLVATPLLASRNNMEMTKDFSRWNEKQKQLDAKQERLYFRAGEIWWVHLGENIGVEANGKSDQYLRPAIILKKFNIHSFLSVPLTTSPIRNKYRISIGKILNKEAAANISQLRYMDAKRLAIKICPLELNLFNDIKKKASEINFR